MATGSTRAAVGRGDQLFLDEFGRPSDRSGPDLKRAAPIETVINDLNRRRKATYPKVFLQAVVASGMDLSVIYTREGEEQLLFGQPADSQEELRRRRYEALAENLRGRQWRRRAVLDLVNKTGLFADNRSFGSVEEAADAYLAASGRICVSALGTLEHELPMTRRMMIEDGWTGYPLRRLQQRFEATLCVHGRDRMAGLVKRRGMFCAGTSAIVLERDQV